MGPEETGRIRLQFDMSSMYSHNVDLCGVSCSTMVIVLGVYSQTQNKMNRNQTSIIGTVLHFKNFDIELFLRHLMCKSLLK